MFGEFCARKFPQCFHVSWTCKMQEAVLVRTCENSLIHHALDRSPSWCAGCFWKLGSTNGRFLWNSHHSAAGVLAGVPHGSPGTIRHKLMCLSPSGTSRCRSGAESVLWGHG